MASLHGPLDPHQHSKLLRLGDVRMQTATAALLGVHGTETCRKGVAHAGGTEGPAHQSSSRLSSTLVWFSPFLYSSGQSTSITRGLWILRRMRPGATTSWPQAPVLLQPAACPHMKPSVLGRYIPTCPHLLLKMPLSEQAAGAQVLLGARATASRADLH